MDTARVVTPAAIPDRPSGDEAARKSGVVVDVSDALTRSMLESSPNIVFLYSITEQRYLYVSPQSAGTLGYAPE